MIDRSSAKALQIPRNVVLLKVHKKASGKRPIFALQYDPRLPAIQPKVAKHWRSMKTQDRYHRITDHRGYIAHQVTSRATGHHWSLPGHSLADLKVTILEQSKSKDEDYRKERETFFIRKLNTLRELVRKWCVCYKMYFFWFSSHVSVIHVWTAEMLNKY